MKKKYTLLIHGGAGAISQTINYGDHIMPILAAGRAMLESGESALNVVERSVMLLENDYVFNAGRGSVLNEDGKVEMDAGIMDGSNLQSGAVAGITNVKNSISLARKVLDNSEHVMLIGSGAMKFAEENKIEFEADDYFITDMRLNQLRDAKSSGQVVLDHSSINPDDKKLGTVGAIALDHQGNIAAATSTGGIVNKKYGRTGDTPIIGAGVYADNKTIAMSGTGYGEQFIRSVIGKYMADMKEFTNISTSLVASRGIAMLKKRVSGVGGVIVIDNQGGYSSDFSTPGMIHGIVTESRDPEFIYDKRLKF